ncbi:MAG: putative manganese-dependent inorganic diphosphatase [Ardenticatenales bacterium]|nr:putative manganese-dependent inorganic diphosphatase [Ardenticatenales bacterium]
MYHPIYIFGHKNPDTDTICSAIAYAYLKNTQSPGHIPARLGEMNRESEFVLRHFGVPAPILLPHVYIRAEDVMTENPITASAEATVYEVGQLMWEHEIHEVPIVDEVGKALGVVTERSLARGYLKELHVQSMNDIPMALGKIADTLNATILVGQSDTRVSGNTFIGAMSPPTMKHYITEGDVVILGNRENAQEAALSCKPSCLVITGGEEPLPRIQQVARAQGTALLVTPHDTFATARLINLSVPAQTLLHTDVLTVSPDSIVNEITPDLLASKHEIALVNDEAGHLVGVLTKGDIAARRRHKVILVDHSERSQSADGIDRADILEILDHHRLGGLETSGPILAMIAPVGCTATLVFRRYQELGVTPPREMAGLMVAALLSDTMLLKSPTTTPEDVSVIKQLGEILGTDPLTFGREMYLAKFDMARLSPDAIACTDLKSFMLGSANVAIGQLEVADKATVLQRKAEILEAMARHQSSQGYDLQLLMVTDILSEGTELLAVGRTRIVERAFNVSLQDSSVYLPGVLSRKQQVVPPLSAVL